MHNAIAGARFCAGELTLSAHVGPPQWRRKKTEVTFGDVATAYLAEHERGWRNEKAPRETAAGAGDLVEGEHLPSGGLDLCRIVTAFPAHRLNV